MSLKITALYSWVNLETPDVASFANYVVKLMTDNIDFPDPPIPLTAISDAATLLVSIYPNRKSGVANKNDYKNAVKNLDTILHKTADYVSFVANSDITKIVSTGFLPSKSSRSVVASPGNPGIVKLTPKPGGILNMAIEKVAGAKSYVYVVFLGENHPNITIKKNTLVLPPNSDNMIIIPCGGLRETLTNLERGTKVYVKALAQNSTGISAFCTMNNTYLI